MKSYKITGTEAIRLAERDGLTLHCHANPVDGGGIVTLEKAREIVREDQSLIYVLATPTGWYGENYVFRLEGPEGYNVDDYFRGAEYLGPDEFGVEPTWTDTPAKV